METIPNLSNKKIIFWEDQGFLQYSIAYWLQKKLDCKMYAISEVTSRPKIFFQSQNLVNFENMWFFHDQIKKKSTKPDLDYLEKFEKKYKINLWKLAINERFFYNHNRFYIKAHIRIYCFKINKFLIILDNFEDTNKESQKKYLDFFDRFEKIDGGRTKIIVTGRSDIDHDEVFQRIKLNPLTPLASNSESVQLRASLIALSILS
jgi:hypothetical protein